MTVSVSGCFQKKLCASMSTSMRSRISLKFWPPRSGASSVEKLRVARLRAVDVRAREDDELRHLELRDVLEELGEAGDVPRVVLGRRGARVVHDAEVDDGLDVAGAEDVLQLLPAEVDLRVLDVLRLVGEGAPVDADDAALAVEHARERACPAGRRCR